MPHWRGSHMLSSFPRALVIRQGLIRRRFATMNLVSVWPLKDSATPKPLVSTETRAFISRASKSRNDLTHEVKAQVTDFERLDIFCDSTVPPTSLDAFLPGGFRLNNGTQVVDGSGVLLVGGEAFAWRPWRESESMINMNGQWEVDDDAFGLLDLVWPRPGTLLDLLVLGIGREIRPLSPRTKHQITALGMRIEVLDTRNAASQFNLLATERGVDDIAAALIPEGWEGGKEKLCSRRN